MHAFLRYASISLALTFGSAVAEVAPDKMDIESVIDSAVIPIIQEHGIPGLAVAVSIGGKRHFRNYGVLSKESLDKVDQRTIFEIGSLSKTFTATLSSYAERTGAISLSDTVGMHLSSLRTTPIGDVSLLNLGTYTAGGLPLQFPDEISTERDVMEYFKTWNPSFERGQQRLYSNPSIGLLGYIAAASLGLSFTNAVEEIVLSPLKMNNTFYFVPSNKLQTYALGYTRDNRPTRVKPGVFDSEAYGAKTTSEDLISFIEANMHAGKDSNALRNAIEDTHIGRFKTDSLTQGLGWESLSLPLTLEKLEGSTSSEVALKPALVSRSSVSKVEFLHKTGSTSGFGAYAAFFPFESVGIVMLANKNYPNSARVRAAFRILKEVTPKLKEAQ